MQLTVMAGPDPAIGIQGVTNTAVRLMAGSGPAMTVGKDVIRG